jgi:hypothetical protein
LRSKKVWGQMGRLCVSLNEMIDRKRLDDGKLENQENQEVGVVLFAYQ